MRYYINPEIMIGVEALDRFQLKEIIEVCPAHESLNHEDFTLVSPSRYDDTVLDLRYEDGRWAQ